MRSFSSKLSSSLSGKRLNIVRLRLPCRVGHYFSLDGLGDEWNIQQNPDPATLTIVYRLS